MQGPYVKDKSRKLAIRWGLRDDFIHPSPIFLGAVVPINEFRTGYSNRNWRQLIRSHTCATTDLVGTYTNFESNRGSLKLVYKFTADPNTYREEAWGDLAASITNWSVFNPIDPSLPDALPRAIADAYKKIREAQVQVSGPTFLGEAKETLRMLRHPAEGLRNLSKGWLDHLKKVKKAKPKTWKADISGSWLEYSFGWKPLIHDIQDSMKAWNRLFDTERILPFSGFGVQQNYIKTSVIGPTLTQGFNNYSYSKYTHTDIAATIVKIRGAVRAEAKTGGRAQLELFGLTPSEFLPTAWELLPWSFLVDYFTNIGDIISAGVTDTSGVIWVSRTEVKTYERLTHLVIDPQYIKDNLSSLQIIYAGGSESSCRWKRRQVNRVATFPLSVPTLYFQLPGSDGQLANMAALLGQANALHPQKFHR